jgi:hypothetical protein
MLMRFGGRNFSRLKIREDIPSLPQFAFMVCGGKKFAIFTPSHSTHPCSSLT